MPKKMGAPRKEVDFEQLKKLCNIQCTAVEIAGFFDMSDDTLVARIKEKHDMTFSEFFKKYSSMGKISLRRNQLKLAEKNVAMAIWLGKQYLGQKDPDKSVVDEVNKSELFEKLKEVL
jgi:hypothetical protein